MHPEKRNALESVTKTSTAWDSASIPKCEVCGSDMPVRSHGRGRPRKYCRASCRQVAYRERRGQTWRWPQYRGEDGA